MSDRPNVAYARVPGAWCVGDRFDSDGYQWEIAEVLSVEGGYTTFMAQRLHPLDNADS